MHSIREVTIRHFYVKTCFCKRRTRFWQKLCVLPISIFDAERGLNPVPDNFAIRTTAYEGQIHYASKAVTTFSRTGNFLPASQADDIEAAT